MIKKILVLVGAALFVFGLTACGKDEQAAEEATGEAPAVEAAPMMEEAAPMMEEAAPMMEEAAPAEAAPAEEAAH
jgi:hypothetical protein